MRNVNEGGKTTQLHVNCDPVDAMVFGWWYLRSGRTAYICGKKITGSLFSHLLCTWGGTECSS